MPWDRRHLTRCWSSGWSSNRLDRVPHPGGGLGLGDDAAFLAARGYRVIAFDISKSAIESARRRFPTSPVDFRVADLLNPPAEWRQHFDLVVETYTTQSLPVRLRPTVALHVGRFVAPGAHYWCWPPHATVMNSSTGRRGRSAAPTSPLQSRVWRW